jgi:hypothetical protein
VERLKFKHLNPFKQFKRFKRRSKLRTRTRLWLVCLQGGQRLGGKAFDLFLALWIMGNHEL